MYSTLFLITLLSGTSFAKSYPRVPVQGSYDPGSCNSSNHGYFKMVKDRENNDRLLICSQDSKAYKWKTTDGSSLSGEFFNPSYDCSEILNKNSKAKSGFYWVHFNDVTSKKVYCDMRTDGGGFMLIAKKNGPKTYSVPSNDDPVHPFGSPHWSSSLGNAPILDFRIQVSSSRRFEDTKAHWSYRLQAKRPLKKLMVMNEGCGTRTPGIGHIKYVKDLQTEKIVSTTFRCSIFGGYSFPLELRGWSMMNYCLKQKCSGTGFHHKGGYQTSDTGAFSYSATNAASGITKGSTAFVGCDAGKCCACYGPVGGKKDYCDPECKTKNGGRKTRSVHIWIWVRSSVPNAIWTKCMEYEVKSEKTWYRIDGNTGEKQKGRCPNHAELSLNDGIVVAQDGNAFKTIPAVTGLLSYRRDNKKLYVRTNDSWTALSTERKFERLEKEVKKLSSRIPKNPSCKQLKKDKPHLTSGRHLIGRYMMYCDMSSGWTLVAAFSNSDSKNWMQSSGEWWYDKVLTSGATTNSSSNADMISEAFWKVSGNEIKITRSDDSSHTALLQTTSNCLHGKTFRENIASYGDFRNGTVWANDKCLGSCRVSYSGKYKTTAGFEQHRCNGNIQSSKYIGFWCDWSAGDGAVMMIGGGGSSCARADHGIGITEENAAKFGGSTPYWDFGYDADATPPSSYSLNLWVR